MQRAADKPKPGLLPQAEDLCAGIWDSSEGEGSGPRTSGSELGLSVTWSEELRLLGSLLL